MSFEPTFYTFQCPKCGKVEEHFIETLESKWACSACSTRNETILMENKGKADNRELLRG